MLLTFSSLSEEYTFNYDKPLKEILKNKENINNFINELYLQHPDFHLHFITILYGTVIIYDSYNGDMNTIVEYEILEINILFREKKTTTSDDINIATYKYINIFEEYRSETLTPRLILQFLKNNKIINSNNCICKHFAKSIIIEFINNKFLLNIDQINDSLLSDKEVVIQLIAYYPCYYSNISKELQEDRDILVILSSNSYNYHTKNIIRNILSNNNNKFCNDKELMLLFLNNKHNVYDYASSILKIDEDIVKSAIIYKPFLLNNFPKIQDNEESVLRGIKKNTECFTFASKRLKNDKQFVISAMKVSNSSIDLFKGLSQRLRSDKEVFESKPDKEGLIYCSIELQYELIKEKYVSNCSIFEYVSTEISDNPELVLSLLKINGLLLQSIPKYKDNIKLVSEAVRQNGLSLQHASKELRDNKDIVLEAVSKNGLSLQHASKRLKNDRHIVQIALDNNIKSIEHVSPEIRNDKILIISVIRQNGLLLKYASKELQSDKEVVLEAIKQNGNAIKYSYPEMKVMKNYPNGKRIWLKESKPVLRYQFGMIYKDILIEALKQNGNVIKYAYEVDKELILTAVENNVNSLEYVKKIKYAYEKDKEILDAINKKK